MEKIADTFKNLLQEKHACYVQLTSLLGKEREAIITMDVDTLWQITAEKNAIVKAVEALRLRMIHLFDAHGIDHGMDLDSFRLSVLTSLVPGPASQRVEIETVRVAIDGQKNEIQRLAPENKRCVGEYLAAIQEVISTIVRLTGQEQYAISGKLCESKQPNRFIRVEV